MDDEVTVSRKGNRHPLARPEFDQGPASRNHRLDRMVLILAPDAKQERALEALLAGQQNPRSPQYHQWLTPESFGKSFGASERDLEEVVTWLSRHGFEVEPVAASRREIVFSGTAAEVEAAFHTEIHEYIVNGEKHIANSKDPEVPAALAPVVSGVASLNDFHSRPLHQGLKPLRSPAAEYSNSATHYMAPVDFTAIYDVGALYSSAIDGTGQSVAVVGRSNFNTTDVTNFRNSFGLPSSKTSVVLNGPNPGIVSSSEQTEAELDVQWAGAVAKNAAVQFVLSGSTSTTDGVLLSSQYIVNHNLAPVMTLSFGLCEAAMGAAQNQAWNNLWQQAALQGITVLVSSGDSGAAGCDGPTQSRAVNGNAVNGLCSSPYSTCVGGTQFDDTANPSLYWSTTTDPHTYGSAFGYIPEVAWNSSATAGGSGLWATGGGASSVYAKPAWQTGNGVPADGRRDVPDVSLNASTHDGYLFFLNGKIYLVGGTSAATPAFAGLIALAVQHAGSRLGFVNSILYGLAANQWNGGAAVFHDVTSGNNSVPGVAGASAGPGYDAATGLGSVDALMLINHWSDPPIPAAPSYRFTASTSSVAIAPGATSNLQVNVGVTGGFSSTVTFSAASLPSGVTANFSPAGLPAPGSGSSTLTLRAASSALVGTYNVSLTASAAGLTETMPLAITIQPNCTYSINPASIAPAASGGSFTAAVTAPNGCFWTAASAFNWITVTAGASGSGNGSVLYSVAANSSSSSRTGSLSIAGLTLAVGQAGATAAAPPLNPSSATFPASGGRASITVALPQANAAWTATSNANWITITRGASSASGNKTVNYSVASNPSALSRTGTITIAGLAFTVTEAGSACSYQIAIGNMTPASGGFNGTIGVKAPSSCPWSAVSNANWITMTSGTIGTGIGTVGFFVANNPNPTPRTGTMSVAGYTIQVTEGAGSH